MVSQTIMFSEGDKVKIIYSHELQDLHLIGLSGQCGIVTKCVLDGHSLGAFIQIERGKNKGEEWFVPIRSIQTEKAINRLKSIAVLKQKKV